MKRIVALCILTALCLTFLCSCDMGNGLIAELFGNNVGNYVPGGDVILVDPIEPDVQTNVEIETETRIEVDYAIPKLAQVEYLVIYVMYADGSTKELMSYDELLSWNGSLSVPYAPGAILLIKAYAAYFYSDAITYRCNVPGSTCGTYDFSWSDLPEDHGPIQGDGVHSFYIEIPLDSLSVGYNQVELYAYATDIMIDGWVMMQAFDVALEALEGDMTEDDGLDTDYPVPPETLPPETVPAEDMTGAPDVEETTEDVTYG